VSRPRDWFEDLLLGVIGFLTSTWLFGFLVGAAGATLLWLCLWRRG